MFETTIELIDTKLHYRTTTTERLTCPMTLDALAHIIDTRDQTRVIIFARYGGIMPSNIKGVLHV